jgi:hypothetical protein
MSVTKLRRRKNSALVNERNYQTAAPCDCGDAGCTGCGAIAGQPGPGPWFDGPGHFEAVPFKEFDHMVVGHWLNSIPDGGTGVTIAVLYTELVTAQALVKRLNNGGR